MEYRKKVRIAYGTIPVLILILPDLIFFHSGVPTIVGLILTWLAYERGPEFSAVLEKEGLHPRGLMPGRVVVSEIKPPSRLEEPAEKVQYTEEEEYVEDFDADDSVSQIDGLEQDGYLKPGADFVVAVRGDDSFITMPALSSLGIGGRQGSGKTVSMMNLVTQAIPKYNGNVRFLVIDPHMGIDPDAEEADNSLAVKLADLKPFLLRVDTLPNPVAGGKDLLKWMGWLENKKDARLGKNGKPATEKADEYIVILADEFSGLANEEKLGPRLIQFLVDLNEQARKVRMFAIVSSNTWLARRMGGTDLRNSIASFVVHNMPAAIAGQIVDPAMARNATKLGVGEVLVSIHGEEDRGFVPYARPPDLKKQVDKYKPQQLLDIPRAKQKPVSNPDRSNPTPSSSVSVLSHASYAEGMVICRYFDLLTDIGDATPEEIIAIIALKVYGPMDTQAEEKVRSVVELREKHGK